MEASLARKRAITNPQPAQINGASSTSDSGAMDSLLEKLRAAAPQARGQRDRRRRAYLKDRHQIRVPSGQKMPDNLDGGGTGEREHDLALSDHAEKGDRLDTHNTDGEHEKAGAVKEDELSEGEDIADRAASMLQGLRDNSAADSKSERWRRRRESADEERRNRKMRRRNGLGSISSSGSIAHSAKDLSSPTKTDVIPEAEADGDDASQMEEEGQCSPPPPSIVVSADPVSADPEEPASDQDDRRPSASVGSSG